MTTSASYPLAPDPSPSAAASSTTSSDVVPNAAPFTASRGLLLPFVRNQRDDFANAGGREMHVARVRLFCQVRGPTERGPGEIPWRPQDGAALQNLRHANNTRMFRAMAAHLLNDAFRRSLPGYTLTDVVSARPEKGVTLLTLKFDVEQGNAPPERDLTVEVAIPTA